MDGFSHLLGMADQWKHEPISSLLFLWDLKSVEEISYSLRSDHTATYHLVLLAKSAQENFAEETSFPTHRIRHVCNVSSLHTAILEFWACWPRNLPLACPVAVSSGPLGTNSLTQCLRKVTSGVGSGCLGACQLVYPLIPAPETRIRWGLSQAEWVTHPLPHLPSRADLRALFPCIPQRGILCSLHPYEWCGSSKTLLQEHTAISFSI